MVNVFFGGGGGSLESTYCFLFAFWPKILGGAGDLRIIFLLENECSLSRVDSHRWLETSNPTTCSSIFWTVCTLRWWGHKNVLIFLVLFSGKNNYQNFAKLTDFCQFPLPKFWWPHWLHISCIISINMCTYIWNDKHDYKPQILKLKVMAELKRR